MTSLATGTCIDENRIEIVATNNDPIVMENGGDPIKPNRDVDVEAALTDHSTSLLSSETNDGEEDSTAKKQNEEIESDPLARPIWGELIAAVVAGLLFIGLAYVPGGPVRLYIFNGLLCFTLGSYVLYKLRKYGFRKVSKDWGLLFFAWRDFKLSFLWCTLVGVVAVAAIWICMAIRGTSGLPFHYDLILMLLLYPLWGCVQQFLVQNLIGLNLHKTKWMPYPLVVLLTACAFTVVHINDWWLFGATFFLGLFFTPIYLRWKCLYPLGLYHGWIGTLFYWFILENDSLRT